MGLVDGKRIQQAHGIVHHVMKRVGGIDRQTDITPHDGRERTMLETPTNTRRLAHVPVIKADHPVAPLNQTVEQRFRPEHHLGRQPHNEHNRFPILGAAAFVEKLNTIAGDCS